MNVYPSESSVCFFRGLHLGEMRNGDYSLVDEVCTEFNAISSLTLQTRGQNLVIALFWYKGYSSISSTLALTVTNCTTVVVNLCRYFTYYALQRPKCHMYLKQITQPTKLKLIVGRYDKRTAVMYFFLPERYCAFLFLTAPLKLPKNPQTFHFFNFCKITIVSKPGEDKINSIDLSIERPNFVEVVGQKPCLISRNLTCKLLSNEKKIQEAYSIKYFDRSKLSTGKFFTEINLVHVRIHYRVRKRNWVNIMLIGSKKEKYKIQYGFSLHGSGGNSSSDLLEKVLASKHMIGTDWLLSTISDVKLGSQNKSIFCEFTMHKFLDYQIFSPITVGKHLKYILHIIS